MKKIFWIVSIVLFCAAVACGQSQTPNVGFQVPAYQQTNWQVPINFDLNKLDTLLGGSTSLPTGTTPRIGAFSNYITANVTPTTITNFVNGFPGQSITVICGISDTSTSIASSANISLSGSFTCSAGQSIRLTLIGTVWYSSIGAAGATGPTGPAGPTGPTGSISTNSGASIGGPAIFAGPSPYVDPTYSSYGMRAVSSTATTTGSCAGTTAVTLASASTFQNGDGIVLYGCGATETMIIPSAPTVTSGISNMGATTPDSILTAATGSTSYCYLLFGRDRFGGLTVPSTPTCISNGLPSLGMQILTVTSAALTGNSLAITIPSPTIPLAAGEMVYFYNSSDARTSAQGIVSSTGGGGTVINVTGLPTQIESSATINSTGGTLIYATGNSIAWTPDSSVWEYGICASRPGDGGAYHFIGLSYPQNSNNSSNSMFTDWGAAMTAPPSVPSYITDATCSAVLATNDYLATTIASGAGTTSLILANAASRTATGIKVIFSEGPTFRKAATAAASSGIFLGTVAIPATTPASLTYPFNDYTDTSTLQYQLRLDSFGLVLNETFVPPAIMYGTLGGNNPTGSLKGVTQIVCNTAWPCLWAYRNQPTWSHIGLITGGNQSLGILFDVGAAHFHLLDTVSLSSSASSTDYCSTMLVMRPASFFVFFNNLTTVVGPGNLESLIGSTWCPAIYFDYNTNGGADASGPLSWHFDTLSMYARTLYAASYTGAGGLNSIDHMYVQGGLMPLVTLHNLAANIGMSFHFSDVTNDTSPTALLAIFGGWTVNIDASSLFPASAEVGGIPNWITGHELISTISVSSSLNNFLLGNNTGTIGLIGQFPVAATTGSIGGGSIANGACASGTVSIIGVTTNNTVQVSPNTYPGDGYNTSGYVSGAGTVTVKVCNATGSSGTPTGSTYNVRVTQ